MQVKSLTNMDDTAQYRAKEAVENLEQAAFEALEQHCFQEALGYLNDMESILAHPVLTAPSSVFASQFMENQSEFCTGLPSPATRALVRPAPPPFAPSQ